MAEKRYRQGDKTLFAALLIAKPLESPRIAYRHNQ